MEIRSDNLEQNDYGIFHVLREVDRQYMIYTRNNYLQCLVIKESISSSSSLLESRRVQLLDNICMRSEDPAIKF